MRSTVIRKKTILLKELLYTCSKRGLSFVVYQMPNTSNARLVIEWKGGEKTSEGFVFAPYNHQNKALFINLDEYFEIDGDSISMSEVTLGMILNIEPINFRRELEPRKTLSQEAYEMMVHEAVKEIKSGSMDKVVLSRTIEKEINCNAFDVWDKLRKYKNAFVYYVSSQTAGEWVGATPEFLLSRKENQIKTVALAGTRKSGAVEQWGEKEVKEQLFVSDYIEEGLGTLNITGVQKKGPQTHFAGPVEHLKTLFRFKYEGSNSSLIEQLHPTPAVCGIPKGVAQERINNLEGYDRGFYAGYLGPVNINNESAYFVNLRCMELGKQSVRLYVGAGITKDSDPRSEWEETNLKAQTLLSVIE